MIAALTSLTACFIIFEILTYRLFSFFGTYFESTMTLSFALLGVGIGGFFFAVLSEKAQRKGLLYAAGCLPFCPLFLLFFPSIESIELIRFVFIFPFSLFGFILAVLFTWFRPEKVYFLDLIGAFFGLLIAGLGLSFFREEGMLFVLFFLLVMTTIFLVSLHKNTKNQSDNTPDQDPLARKLATPRLGRLWFFLLGTCCLLLIMGLQLKRYQGNLLWPQFASWYPGVQFLVSKSSLIGRYDVLRYSKDAKTIKGVENGRVIDTIRPITPEESQIDPRLPFPLKKDPNILIIGLSGDGITKTARSQSKHVTGLEINPHVIALHKNELKPFNKNSYDGITVKPIDARTYIHQSKETFDMITLLNTHVARGSIKGRIPSPEYLYTKEAFHAYFDRLSEKGRIIIEDPISSVLTEYALWKMLWTIRTVLAEKGLSNPEHHVYLFNWTTRRNNYMQLVIQKTPFSKQDLAALNHWLDLVNRLKTLQSQSGKRLGPIQHVLASVIYEPYAGYKNVYERLLKGNGAQLRKNLNLSPLTDNRPFLYDINPNRNDLLYGYGMFLGLIFIFTVLFLYLYGERKWPSVRNIPVETVFIVILSGLSFFLIELALIQLYQLLFGSPIMAFSLVLSVMFIMGGLGSYCSSMLPRKRLPIFLLLGALLILSQWFLFSSFFHVLLSFPKWLVYIAAILFMLPLGFILGMPFPQALVKGKEKSSRYAAILFGMNGMASAIASPLSMAISVQFGYAVTVIVSVACVVMIALLLMNTIFNRQRTVMASVVLIVVLLLPFMWDWRRERRPDPYQVYAIRYGLSKSSVGLKHAQKKRRNRFSWNYWLIVGEGKRVLVDTGFDDKRYLERWRLKRYVSPLSQLSQLGIQADEVTDVIITHAHWDHIDTLKKIPNARVWIQKKELESMRKKLKSASFKKGMSVADLKTLARCAEEGRLRVLNSSQEIYPGIAVHLVGGHTPGHQVVSVKQEMGDIVLVSDYMYYQRHNRVYLDERELWQTVKSDPNNRLFYKHAASAHYVIPGHDAWPYRFFTWVAPSIVRISP